MLAKINIPTNDEVGLVAATTGAARGDGKKYWDLDPGASFHISHTQAGMNAYKKAPAGTVVQVADGIIFPVDGFKTVEVDLDQSGTRPKPVKVVAVAYVPGLLRNLLSGASRLSSTKWRLFRGSRGRSRLLLTSTLARDCFPQEVRTKPRVKVQRWRWKQKRLN